jgi:hypothetical protein
MCMGLVELDLVVGFIQECGAFRKGLMPAHNENAAHVGVLGWSARLCYTGRGDYSLATHGCQPFSNPISYFLC